MHGPIRAVQSWKTTKMCTPTSPWGRYGKTGQYVWRCPQVACRNAIVTPAVRAASEIIDWKLPARTIGERIGTKDELAANTLRRITAGYEKFGRPFLVPNEGRDKPPMDILDPLRTVTTRNETGVALPPYMVELRGGGSSHRAITEPLSTVTAGGNHHFLVTAPDMVLPYYSSSVAQPATNPLGTATTVDGHAAVYGGRVQSVEECGYRMLEPHEYQDAMHFPKEYILTPRDKRTKVKMLGNAVTPNTARDLVGMAVEALTGEDVGSGVVAS
jgi:DNA (cytosine-5)-methyltransferase 1